MPELLKKKLAAPIIAGDISQMELFVMVGRHIDRCMTNFITKSNSRRTSFQTSVMPLPFIALPSDHVTRALNKDKHPGNIDRPQPHCTHADVEESHCQEEEKARQEEERHTEHMEMVAAIKDAQQHEDEHCESEQHREADVRKKAKAAG